MRWGWWAAASALAPMATTSCPRLLAIDFVGTDGSVGYLRPVRRVMLARPACILYRVACERRLRWCGSQSNCRVGKVVELLGSV